MDTWYVAPSKYTKQVVEGIDKLSMDFTMLNSRLEGCWENPMKPMDFTVFENDLLDALDMYAELNNCVKDMNAPKPKVRRLCSDA